MLAVAGCCGNPGGALVPVDAGIDVGLTTAGVGVAAGYVSISSAESGTTSFGTGVPASGGGATSAVSSSSWGAIGVFSSETEVPGGLVLDSGRVMPAKGWGSLMAGVLCLISVRLSESYPSDESCRS